MTSQAPAASVSSIRRTSMLHKLAHFLYARCTSPFIRYYTATRLLKRGLCANEKRIWEESSSHLSRHMLILSLLNALSGSVMFMFLNRLSFSWLSPTNFVPVIFSFLLSQTHICKIQQYLKHILYFPCNRSCYNRAFCHFLHYCSCLLVSSSSRSVKEHDDGDGPSKAVAVAVHRFGSLRLDDLTEHYGPDTWHPWLFQPSIVNCMATYIW